MGDFDLIELKDRLRRLPNAARASLSLDAASLAEGYRQLLSHAPQRLQGYLSATRSGITASGDNSNRTEEHLAVGLFNRGRVSFVNGRSVSLIDYQFPLKSARADRGIGKIDLLGLCDDATLAVIEVKTDRNREDRRIALLEGLIYAGIVEANLPAIADEVFTKRSTRIDQSRPRVLIVAPGNYWEESGAPPLLDDFITLVERVAAAIPLQIELCCLHDVVLTGFGLGGRRPLIAGHGFLSTRRPTTGWRPAARSESYQAYLERLRDRFAAYRSSFEDDVFDGSSAVFRRPHADRNIMVPREATPAMAAAMIGAIPPQQRHRHFASMRSSQALAQSVFAGVAAFGRLDVLERLVADDGFPAFFQRAQGHALTMEHAVGVLAEPRATSVDVFLSGPRRVAVEVKFTEGEFGRCSRPRLRLTDANFERDHCDGSYRRQRGRSERCTLTQLGICYWRYLPELFEWDSLRDHRPCPLEPAYQIARTILAACVNDDGELDPSSGHALVIYDERNPAFQPGGDADAQWWSTIAALRHPRTLRRVSWQRLLGHLAGFPDLEWLCAGLHDKYGLTGPGVTVGPLLPSGNG